MIELLKAILYGWLLYQIMVEVTYMLSLHDEKMEVRNELRKNK